MLKTVFENIYDRYCPLLYNIALQLCTNENKAETVLILTFQKIHRQNLGRQESTPFCIDLIKLIVQTAQEELYRGETKCNFRIKQFEKTPLLHKLLLEPFSIDDYCMENNITRQHAFLNLRKEFMMIRDEFEKKNSSVEFNVLQLN